MLASQSSKLLNVNELSNTTGLSRPTIEHYLFLMQNTYVLHLLSPFSGNLRSELFKTPKVFFFDSGIANLLHLKMLPKTILGTMFESSVFSELIKHGKQSSLHYWRTQDKKEIDFIVREPDRMIPYEVKLNQSLFKPTAMNYFCSKYGIKESFCISLEIAKRESGNVLFIYPWEY